jgi:thioesterase domain-containing protein
MIQKLQHFLHTEIPLTKDMGLELVKFSHNKLQAIAPLSQNINDKGSVFGGSSSALMIISAWS